MITIATLGLSLMLPFLAPSANTTVNAGVSAAPVCPVDGANPPLCG
ncbi:MAG: hypothetical protein ABR591_09875 [Candidatus Velthaea sp.]